MAECMRNKSTTYKCKITTTLNSLGCLSKITIYEAVWMACNLLYMGIALNCPELLGILSALDCPATLKPENLLTEVIAKLSIKSLNSFEYFIFSGLLE